MERWWKPSKIAWWSSAPADGILPEDFYATSHLSTQIRWQGNWIDVPQPEMDLAILVKTSPLSAHMIPMGSVKKGDLVVTGRKGIRVFPLERPKERDVFGFMEAQVSSERPHRHIIADVAKRMKTIRQQRRQEGKGSAKVLFAGGPAIIHAGGREALAWIIEVGLHPCAVLRECPGRARHGSQPVRDVIGIQSGDRPFRAPRT